VVGYAAIVQVTIGVQLGGQTFNELVVFQSRQALDAFKHGKGDVRRQRLGR
jgi:lipid-binding SYLF domain-containing protein